MIGKLVELSVESDAFMGASSCDIPILCMAMQFLHLIVSSLECDIF